MTTICFVGAGSVEFTRDLVADILRFPELADATLRLHDIDEDRLETALGVAHSVARQLGAHPTVSAHLERREALEGADFVIDIVQIGGLAATKVDFEVPARFGLRQTIADTLGIGAIFRGLRTFPFLKALADDIADVAPGALLLNYTNPMAMNVGYLAKVAPKLPLRVLDDPRSQRDRRGPAPGGHLDVGGGQPPGVGALDAARRHRPLSPPRREDP